MKGDVNVKRHVLIFFLLVYVLLYNVGCANNTNKIDLSNYANPTANENNENVLNENTLNENPKPVAEDEVYYLVGMHIILPYWQDHRRGLETAAKELGVKVVFTGENGNDAARQVDIFEQIITKKPAGILVSPIDPEMMIEPINKAISLGIPVVCIDTDSPKSNRLTYLGTDNYVSGQRAGEILAKAIGYTGEVGILTIPGVYSLDERQRGFEEYLEKNYPKIKVTSVMNDEADPSRAANIAAQMLKAAPNVSGIFGTDAASAVGAVVALRKINKLGKVKIIAFDKDSSVLKLVEQGEIEATLVQRTFTMSYYGLKFLYDFRHKSIKMTQDMTGLNPLPPLVDAGIIVVKKDNVQKFK